MHLQHYSRRNLLGALLGGICAIVSFGYLVPVHQLLGRLALPIGCFIGVVLGFWHQELLHSAAASWRRNTRYFATRPYRERLLRYQTRYAMFRKASGVWLRRGGKRILASVAWFFHRPVAFFNWLGRHPMNLAYTIRAATILAFFGIQAVLMVVFYDYWTGTGIVGGFLNAFMAIGVLFAFLYGIIRMYHHTYPDEVLLGMREFYLDYAYYADHGILGFIGHDFSKLLRTQVGTMASFFRMYVMGVWGIIVAVCMASPISIAVGLARTFFVVARRPSHWFCLMVTLAVAVVTAMLVEKYLPNDVLLWSAALATGVVAGVLVEVISHVLVSLAAVSTRLRTFAAVPLGQRLAPVWGRYRATRDSLDKLLKPPIRTIAPWVPEF